MPDLPIPAEAIEAAAKAIATALDDNFDILEAGKAEYLTAARAAFDTLGTRAEERAINYEHKEQRLVSRWFPVKP